MPQKVVFKDLDLQPGVCIKVEGDIAPEAKHFSVNLGKDELNLALHINPRFSAYDDTKCIVFNYLEDGHWNTERREYHFPFMAGNRIKMYITFEGNHFIVKLPDGVQTNFPNHIPLQRINFLSVCGDFTIKILEFE